MTQPWCPPPDRVLDLVIDTDVTNEVDDQFALVWALLRPDRLNLVGLHACPYGLSPDLLLPGRGLLTELDRRKVERDLAAIGLTSEDIPVLPPSFGVERAYEDLVRLTGIAGVDVPVVAGAGSYLPDEATPVDSPAARALIALAHAPREGRLHVAAIGCLTNVASALLLDPAITQRLVVVWTAAYPSFWPYENASYNLAQDVAAARVVLASGVPLVYVPGYYVGEELRVSGPELEAHVAGVGALGDYLWDAVRTHPLFKLDRVGASKVIWDLAPIAWLLDQQWCTSRSVPTPDLDDELRWRPAPGRPEMVEVHDLDRDAVFADLFARLASAR
ncbi:MAG: nucleoside hydrolase [Frankiales bacterium]|nr:nucleoside hydrolase [Frankiales bacterium]